MMRPPEGDDPALPVENGEHDAAPEAVVKAAPLPGRQQPHFLGQLQGDAPALEVTPQGVPTHPRHSPSERPGRSPG